MVTEKEVGISRVMDRIIAKARSKDWMLRNVKRRLYPERDYFLYTARVVISTEHYRLSIFLLSKEMIISSLGEIRSTLENAKSLAFEVECLCALGEEIEEYWQDLRIVIDQEFDRVYEEVRSVATKPSALCNL